MGSLFSLVGSVIGIGATLGGMGMTWSGQQDLMKAQEQMAGASATITTFQAQQQAIQFSLYNQMQQRQALEVQRRGQQARSTGFATIASQVGNMFGSQQGGVRGQTQGEEGTALQGINENVDAASQMYNLTRQIDQQKILMAMYQSQEAQAQGQIAEGQDIMSAGKSLSNIFGGAGSLGNLFGSFGNAAPGATGAAGVDPASIFAFG